MPLRPSVHNGYAFAINMAQFAELLSKRFNVVGLQGRRGNTEVTDSRYFSLLLGTCAERPGSGTTNYREKLAALHGLPSEHGVYTVPEAYHFATGGD